VVRRAIVIAALVLFAAGAAYAQPLSSERLAPPGDDGGYGAPVDEGADPEENPYADPAAGGAYDPSTRSTTAPTPLPGPRGAPSYNPPPAGPAAPQRSHAPAPANVQAGVSSSCDGVAAELQRFRGPPGNPMLPRDEACAPARASAEPGRPNPAFRQCSDDFFREYERKREEHRQCMEQDAGKGDQRLEQRSLTEDAARDGYGGTAPQMAGPYARSGAPGWLGVQIAPVSPQSAYRLGAEGTQGAYVLNAVLGSPAQRAGLRRGDIIIAFDGEAISQPRDLQYQAERLQAGQTVRLDILRGGQQQTLDVQITPRP